ncbi:PKD domain-containing protein [Marinospirillum insulare]|uniref:Transmembrane protein n=1 Tax=Marinospirillum insulare TaxID=217169 RepID=A0ABQ5ZXT0_9GAMM|nr:hypothetical protein [Marinospirillum insulare]GLR63825.1 hypothetical protein GCM10007878_12610 [Marinospirillum insulare]
MSNHKTQQEPTDSFLNKAPLWLKILIILGIGFLLGRWFAAEEGLAVNFTNSSQQQITSIKLDFGSSDGQSSIQTFRLAPQESRTLFLNHPAGMGFNVLVTYADGQQQDFCALKGDTSLRPQLDLNL